MSRVTWLMQCVLNDQVDYFGFLQLGSFYVLLGISCDYVFMYFDAYMQSLVEPLVAATLATRISYMCQRATPVRPLPVMLEILHTRVAAADMFATEPLCDGDTHFHRSRFAEYAPEMSARLSIRHL